MSGHVIDPKTIYVGQHQIIDLEAFAQDNAHLVSTNVDASTTLIPNSSPSGVVSVSMGTGANNRKLTITAIAPGDATVTIDEFLVLATGNALAIDVHVETMPDNRRIDVETFEDPT